MAEEEKKEKKGGKKKFLIIGLALLILGGGGFFGYKFLFAKKKENPQKTEKTVEKKEDKEKEQKGEDSKEEGQQQEVVTEIVSLPTILVNLADPLGRRYLKVSISLEVKGKDSPMLIEKYTPQIKDSLILLLSSKTFEDLNTFDKKLALKKEIVKRLNQILGKSIIRRVFFTEFIIQ